MLDQSHVETNTGLSGPPKVKPSWWPKWIPFASDGHLVMDAGVAGPRSYKGIEELLTRREWKGATVSEPFLHTFRSVEFKCGKDGKTDSTHEKALKKARCVQRHERDETALAVRVTKGGCTAIFRVETDEYILAIDRDDWCSEQRYVVLNKAAEKRLEAEAKQKAEAAEKLRLAPLTRAEYTLQIEKNSLADARKALANVEAQAEIYRKRIALLEESTRLAREYTEKMRAELGVAA